MMDLTLKPRVTEKAYALSVAHNTYVFEVPKSANRLMVADAVAAQYGVAVTDVNITNVKGKAKRTVRKGGRQTRGQRNDIKKAYVTLKAGDSLPIFAAVEEAEVADAKIQEKVAKQASKKAKKEKK
jgi:large subunit ribosomal protein L23